MSSFRGFYPWLLALALLLPGLTGCAPRDGLELDEWLLVTDAGERSVRLPGRFDDSLLRSTSTYRLRRTVQVPPDLKGRELYLTVASLQAVARLRAGGEVAEAIGPPLEAAYRSRGFHTWRVPEASNRGPSLDLEIEVAHTWTRSGWVLTAPVLSRVRGGDPRDRTANEIDQAGLLVGGVAIATLGLMHGLLYALDRRRRQNAWLAALTLTSLTYPLFVSGLLQGWLGSSELVLFGLAQAASPIIGLHFTTAMFGLPPVHRAYWGVFAGLFVFGVLTVTPFAMQPFTWAVIVAMHPPALAHVVRLYRLSKSPGHRHARLLLISWIGTTVVTALVDGAYFAGVGWTRVTGIHAAPWAAFVLTIVHSYVLAKDHVVALHTADALNLELKSRLVELEKRDRQNESLNAELRLQIAERSRELAQALSKLVRNAGEEVLLADGDVIDARYRVSGRIGSGGMGAVYEAVRLSDDVRVAIKVVRGVADGVALARLAQEAELAATVTHPNVTSILDVGVATRGFLYVAMEYVEGVPLSRRSGRFGDRLWALDLLRQVAAAVAAIHERSIVHRDLKPANVLLVEREGEPPFVKLIDFGVSKAIARKPSDSVSGATLELDRLDSGLYEEPSVSAASSSGAELTASGEFVGTPMYMAPESVDGGPVSPAADVFAFGVMAFEMLTGQRAFSESLAVARIAGRKVPRAARLTEACPGLSSNVARLLEAALDLSPERRPTASEIAVALSETHPPLAAASERR